MTDKTHKQFAHRDVAAGFRVAALNLPAPGFEAFTFPRFRPLVLETADPAIPQARIAVGAWVGSTPIGLALYSLPNDEDRSRRLHSVLVTALLRRRGLGMRLLDLGEELARADGAQNLSAVHSSQLKAAPAYEALLRKGGWKAPKEFEYRLAGKANWALQAREDWAPFLARLKQRGFATTTWGALSDEDRAQIAHIVDKQVPEADRAFDPFNPEIKLELVPDLSLLLRRQGEIVGWIHGSLGKLPDSVYYSHGYVLHSARRAGWLIGGVREICERQVALMGGESVSVFETASDNQTMRRFMDRQLKPYSLWTDSRFLSEKKLANGVEPGLASAVPSD